MYDALAGKRKPGRKKYATSPGQTMLVMPDTHWAPEGCDQGGVDKEAESCILQAIGIVKPDIFVHIGDAGEWNSVSRWEWARRKRPPARYTAVELTEDARAVNLGLDQIDAALDKAKCGKTRIMIEGNHEVWVDNFVYENEAYASSDNHFGGRGWSPDKLMKLDDRGWKYEPYGHIFYMGKLGMYHGGHWATKNHTDRHLAELSGSIMYGHTHDQQNTKKATLHEPIGAWSIGCACELDKPFLKGKPTRWSHNMAIVHFGRGGRFNVEVVEIFDGRCFVYGQEVVG
jgi:hypothetical protein